MAIPQLTGSPKRITASGIVAGGTALTGLANPLGDATLAASIIGVICASSTAGTITLYDGQNAAGTLIVNTLPLTAGQYLPLNLSVRNGCYCTVGGTLDCTFVISG